MKNIKPPTYTVVKVVQTGCEMSSWPNPQQSPVGNMKTHFFVEILLVVIIGNELALNMVTASAITITGNNGAVKKSI